MDRKLKLKVLHVVPTLGAGGTELNCMRLVSALQFDSSYANVIASMRLGDGSLRETFEAMSAQKVRVLPAKRWALIRSFNEILRSSSADAVVFHFLTIDQALLALIARLSGVKSVIAAAGNPPPQLKTVRTKVKATVLLNRLSCCPVISASSWVERSLSDVARLPMRSCVVHNAVDVKSFSSLRACRQRDAGSREKWIFGTVGRLDTIKDHRTLFLALRILRQRMPNLDFELKVIGDGPLRSDLEEFSVDLGLKDYIVFMGSRSDIPAQLSELDAFLFSTTWREGFGIVLIEALAAGVPILASDVPSSREVLDEGRFGTILPSGNSAAWGEALATFVLNGPAVAPPDTAAVDAAYGIQHFRDRYLEVLLGKTTQHRSK